MLSKKRIKNVLVVVGVIGLVIGISSTCFAPPKNDHWEIWKNMQNVPIEQGGGGGLLTYEEWEEIHNMIDVPPVGNHRNNGAHDLDTIEQQIREKHPDWPEAKVRAARNAAAAHIEADLAYKVADKPAENMNGHEVTDDDRGRAETNVEKMKKGKPVKYQEKFHKPGPKIKLSELYRKWFAKAHPDHPAVKGGTLHAFKAKVKKLFSKTKEKPEPAWDEAKIVKSTSKEIEGVGTVSKGIEEGSKSSIPKVAGEVIRKAAGPVAVTVEGYQTYKDVERISKEDIPKKEKEYKYARSVTKHATGFGVAWGGAAVGAKYGAIIGALIGGSIGTLPLPGAGTLTGGAIGGIAGGIIGGAIGGIIAGVGWDKLYDAAVPQNMSQNNSRPPMYPIGMLMPDPAVLKDHYFVKKK